MCLWKFIPKINWSKSPETSSCIFQQSRNSKWSHIWKSTSIKYICLNLTSTVLNEGSELVHTNTQTNVWVISLSTNIKHVISNHPPTPPHSYEFELQFRQAKLHISQLTAGRCFYPGLLQGVPPSPKLVQSAISG